MWLLMWLLSWLPTWPPIAPPTLPYIAADPAFDCGPNAAPSFFSFFQDLPDGHPASRF
jgi:hypothetical protein